MKTISALILISALLAGCSSTHRVVMTAENVIHTRLNERPDMGLLVISDERKGQAWYETEEGYEVRSIKNVPQTCLQEVWQVSVSPDDNLLAVVSVGEGHPVLEIFSLNEVFSIRDGWEDEAVEPLLTIDPYPGWVSIDGWESPTVLEVTSDMPLNRLDKSERRVRGVFSDDPERRYFWNIETDVILRE